MEEPFSEARAAVETRAVDTIVRHMFLCGGPDCCAEDAGEASWNRLKSRSAEINKRLDAGVSVYRTKVKCLRICKDGPVGLIYPEGTWYAGLRGEALDRVIDEHLANGRPVPELMIAEHPLGTDTAARQGVAPGGAGGD